MEEAMTTEWKPLAGGLFQLYRDGQSTPVISFVDRSVSRGAQLDQLASHIPWLPEQVVVAAAEQITAGNYQPPEAIQPTTAGRVFAPTPVKLAVLLAPGDAEEAHPLRPHMWPMLDGNGEPLLEPGETVIDKKRIARPRAMEYAENVHTYFTDRRIVTTGKLALPSSVRSDYKISLGLISPTLMEGFAAVKALGRIGQNKSRRWVHHVRYEWLTNVTCLTTTRSKKKLFSGRGPEHLSTWFRGEVRYPNGKCGFVDLWPSFSDERLESLREPEELARQTAKFQQRLEHACRSRGLGWTQSESTVRDIVGGTEAKDVWTLDTAASYSIPLNAIA
jgi:hypothetical protein